MVRAGAVEPHPEGVAGAAARRADVGVGVVTVHAPGSQDPLRESILTRPADVIHDLVPTPLLDRPANATGDVIERFVPRNLYPAASTSPPGPFQRMQDA